MSPPLGDFRSILDSIPPIGAPTEDTLESVLATIPPIESQPVEPQPVEQATEFEPFPTPPTRRNLAREGVAKIEGIETRDIIGDVRKFVETGKIEDSPNLKSALSGLGLLPEDDDSPIKLQVKKLIRQVATLPFEVLVAFPAELIVDPGKTIAGFAQGVSETINDFAILQSPLSTPEQRNAAEDKIADNPIGLAMTAAISTGAVRGGGKALFKGEQAIRSRLAPAEATTVAPRPVTTDVGTAPTQGTVEFPEVQTGVKRVEGTRGGVPVVTEQPVFGKPVAPTPAKVVEAKIPALPPEPTPAPAFEIVTVPGIKGGVKVAEQKVRVKTERGFELVDPETIGLNVLENERIRAEIGANKLDPAAQRTMQSVLIEAEVTNQASRSLELADELIKTQRPITDVEHAGMVLKANELANKYDQVIAEQSKFIKAGETGKAKIALGQSEAIIGSLDKLTAGTRLGRREASRALSIGRMMINRDTYQLATVVQRAQASKGKKLSEKQNTKIEGLVKEQARLKTRLDEVETLNDQLVAARDKAAAERQIKRPRGKRVEQFETIFTEREQLKGQLGQLGFRVNDVAGVTAEASFIIGKLATNYIKEGVTTLAEVVRKVRKDVPSLSERDVHQALGARDPKRQAKLRTETRKRIADIKTQADLLLRIEKAEQGIFNRAVQRPPRIPEIRILQDQLKDLRAQAYKTVTSDVRLQSALKTLGELQDQLANQVRTIKKKRGVDPADIAKIKESISLVRRQMKTEDALASLNEQLRTGNIIETRLQSLKEIPPELERAQIELKRARRNIRVAIDEMAPLTFKKGTFELANTLRTLKATADMSATLRQGIVLSATRPIVATKALGKSMKAFFSENSAQKIDNAIRSADHHYLRERAGLQLTEIEGGRSVREEVFGAQMIEKMPVLGPIVKASNRHMTTHLNLLRTSVFDEFLTKNPNASAAELAAYADWINIATGRGDIGRLAAVTENLSLIFFAPKFAVSRIQTPVAVFKHWKHPRVRKAIAKDFVGFLGIGATVLALSDMAGFEVGTDPRDSDWGKIRSDNIRIDIWGGVQQPTRVGARIGVAVTDKIGITGKELAEREKDIGLIDLFLRFVGYKFSPLVTTPEEIRRGQTLVGEEVTLTQTAIRTIMPLWLSDVADAFRETRADSLAGVTNLERATRAAPVAGLTFFGVGVSTFKDSETKTRSKIARMRRENNWDGADALRFEWNTNNPDNPIVN